MYTDFNQIAQRMSETNAVLPGKRIRIDVDTGQSLLLDGIANTVRPAPGEKADAVLKISVRELGALVEGMLDPKTSYLLGKYQIEGDLPILFELHKPFYKARI